MLSLFLVSQSFLGPSHYQRFLFHLFRRGGLLLGSGGLLLHRFGLLLWPGGLLLHLLRSGGLLPCLLCTGGLLSCLLRPGRLLLRLLCTGGSLLCLRRRGGLLPCLLCAGGFLPCLLHPGGLQFRQLCLASCSASVPGHSTSTWTWPSFPPPGLCHESGLRTSVNSPPEVTRSPQGLLHYTNCCTPPQTTIPIIHCTDDTHS